MKITIDILDEEYMPECPHCHKPVNINDETKDDNVPMDYGIRFICDNCLRFFDVELIVRQAKAIE